MSICNSYQYSSGNERIASRIGNGGVEEIDLTVENIEDLLEDVWVGETQPIWEEVDIEEYYRNKQEELRNHLTDVMMCADEDPIMEEDLLAGLHDHWKLFTDEAGYEPDCYWYHPDHLGSSSWITYTDGEAVQHLHYLPWGEEFVDQRITDFSARHTFSAKERDSETGLSYFGARYYSRDLSIWLSVDPMSDKYPSLSPYVYCADNPVRLVDPNGEAFVGVDGENVEVNKDKNGIITVGENASEDLKRMASMINNSGSKTAAKQFMKLANNDCSVHFQIVQGKGDGSKIGYHQAHDEQGNPLDWVGDRTCGYFDGTPAIQKGEYKEATITIFEGMVDGNDGYKNKTPFDSDLSVDNAMVGVFSHEAEHNLNKFDIKAIKARSAGYYDNVRNVERAAERIERKVYKEMYRNK